MIVEHRGNRQEISTCKGKSAFIIDPLVPTSGNVAKERVILKLEKIYNTYSSSTQGYEEEMPRLSHISTLKAY
jgi:hypothetical protein